MLLLALSSKLFHLLNLSFEGVGQIKDNLSADHEKVAFLVSLGGTITLKVVALLENVCVYEVTALYVSNERHQVGVSGMLFLLLLVSLFLIPDRVILFLLGQQLVNIYLKLNFTQLYQVDFFSVVVFLIENITYE